MAKVDILYHCGCGFRTNDQAQAEKHCDDKRHDLSVTGIIKSSTRTQPTLQPQRTGVSRPVQQVPKVSTVGSADFDRLRRMVKGSRKE